MLRWAGLVLLIVMLLGTGYLGITEGITNIRAAQSPGVWAVSISQLAYGVFGVLAVAAIGARNKIATQLIYAWAVAAILTAGMAPVVYGMQSVLIGLVAGLSATMFMVIPIALWRVRPVGVNG